MRGRREKSLVGDLYESPATRRIIELSGQCLVHCCTTMNINLVLSQELLESVDRARGDVARVRWIRRAIERALATPEVVQAAAEPSSPRSAGMPGTPPIAPRVVMRRSPRVVARPDVRPFQRGKP